MQKSASPLVLDRLGKRYGDVIAVEDVSLTIAPGRFLTLLGPSGSGKTTLLMMIAGFVTPSNGRIHIGDLDITDLPPEKRDFGMVFQGYALFPNMTVQENIGFALRLRNVPVDTMRSEVTRMLDLVELQGLGNRLPRQLSGGQQQRVALARALIFNPRLLLLDEPLSALDKKLRAGLQEELRALHQRLGTTFIFVTHDQDEALSMSDEIAIINRGRIVQRGSPAELYDRPVSHFVADFLGKSNFFQGQVRSVEDGVLSYSVGSQILRHQCSRGAPAAVGGNVLVALRPEKVSLAPLRSEQVANAVRGKVANVAYLGADYHVKVDTGLGPMEAVVPTWRSAVQPALGLDVWLAWDEDASVVLIDDR